MTSLGHRYARDARVCACGCGQPLTHKRAGAKFFSSACRTRAHRARTAETVARARDASQNRYTVAADAFWVGYRAIRRGDLRQRWPRSGT